MPTTLYAYVIKESDDSWLDAQTDPAFDPAEACRGRRYISIHSKDPGCGSGWESKGLATMAEFMESAKRNYECGPWLRPDAKSNPEPEPYVLVVCKDATLKVGIIKQNERPKGWPRRVPFSKWKNTFEVI